MSNEILAILPAYNEEVSIGSIVLHSRQHVDRVIVIDDGSSDRTAEMAKLAGAMVLKHPKNLRYGGAIQTIFKTVREMNANAMVIIDSNGQNDLAEMPKLAEPILAGEADMVNGINAKVL